MRQLLVLTLGLAVAGAAHAQLQPIKPIQPVAPIGGAKPPPAFKPYEPPKPYTPPKSFTGTDTNTAPSGLYPEQHKPKKKPSDGF